MIYLEIDLGTNLRLVAVATHGDTKHFNSSVTSYQVLYRDEATGWKMVTVGGLQVNITCLRGDALWLNLDAPRLLVFACWFVY